MPTTLQSDVDFYSMVHEVLKAALSDDECRRTRERQPFACRQWVAPLVDGLVPAASSYREVSCRDISTGGFSYVAQSVPGTEKLSVRMGKDDGWVYLTAGVVHCRPLETDDGPAFLIGCKFLGRVG